MDDGFNPCGRLLKAAWGQDVPRVWLDGETCQRLERARRTMQGPNMMTGSQKGLANPEPMKPVAPVTRIRTGQG